MEIALIIVIIVQVISSVAIYNLHKWAQELAKGDLCIMEKTLAMSEILMKHEIRISSQELKAQIEQQDDDDEGNNYD